ncbi:MAG: hypothetical protein JST04_09665 [Bdellovibrionales bacterium]|nr:hypothetical protein [Bdellovibrionales bacterium]
MRFPRIFGKIGIRAFGFAAIFVVATAGLSARAGDLRAQATELRGALAELIEGGEVYNHLPFNAVEKAALLEEYFGDADFFDRGLKSGNSSPKLKALLAKYRIKDETALRGYLLEKRAEAFRTFLGKHLKLLGELSAAGKLEAVLAAAGLEDLGGSKATTDQDLNRKLAEMLRKQIERYPEAIAQAAKAGLPIPQGGFTDAALEKATAKGMQDFGPAVAKMTPAQVESLAKMCPETLAIQAQDEVSKVLDAFRLNEVPTVKRLLSTKMNIPNEAMRRVGLTLFESYFDQTFPLLWKKNIFIEVLRTPVERQASEIFGIVVRNSGVVFQKALQFLADRTDSVEFKKIANMTKSGLKKLAPEDFKQLLGEVGLPADLYERVADAKQVAAATTGLGAIAKSERGPLFVKMLRPSLGPDLALDERRILAAVKDPAARQVIEAVVRGIKEEVKLRIEAFRFEVARVLFEGNSNIKIPRIHYVAEKNGVSVMIMDVAEGSDLSTIDLAKLKDSELEALADGYRKSFSKWIEGAFGFYTMKDEKRMKDLFPKLREIANRYQMGMSDDDVKGLFYLFHGDLHGGNVFFDFATRNVTWIDWGNAHRLDVAQIRGQLRAFMGTIVGEPKYFVEGVTAMFPMDAELERKIGEKVLQKFADAAFRARSPASQFAQLNTLLLQNGVELPEAVVNLGRGQGMLTNQFDAVRAEMIRRGFAEKDLPVPSTQLLVEEMKTYLKRNLPEQIVSRAARDSGVIPLKTVFEMGKAWISNKVSSLCKGLFSRRPNRI